MHLSSVDVTGRWPVWYMYFLNFEWKSFISPKVDFFSILHTNIAISGEQIVHLPEKCWSKHIKLHHCVGGLDETSWTITWGNSQKANTSINIFSNKCRQCCKAVGPMLNIWCLSNGKLNLAKANFQESKSFLRSFNFVIGKGRVELSVY